MMESTRVLLNKFFEPFNKELATLLQDDRFLWKDNNWSLLGEIWWINTLAN